MSRFVLVKMKIYIGETLLSRKSFRGGGRVVDNVPDHRETINGGWW